MRTTSSHIESRSIPELAQGLLLTIEEAGATIKALLTSLLTMKPRSTGK
jgi:hypothetical protein